VTEPILLAFHDNRYVESSGFSEASFKQQHNRMECMYSGRGSFARPHGEAHETLDRHGSPILVQMGAGHLRDVLSLCCLLPPLDSIYALDVCKQSIYVQKELF
jgi:hypothetical protein